MYHICTSSGHSPEPAAGDKVGSAPSVGPQPTATWGPGVAHLTSAHYKQLHEAGDHGDCCHWFSIPWVSSPASGRGLSAESQRGRPSSQAGVEEPQHSHPEGGAGPSPPAPGHFSLCPGLPRQPCCSRACGLVSLGQVGSLMLSHRTVEGCWAAQGQRGRWGPIPWFPYHLSSVLPLGEGQGCCPSPGKVQQ